MSYKRNCPDITQPDHIQRLPSPRKKPFGPKSPHICLTADPIDIPSLLFIVLKIVSAGCETIQLATPATNPLIKETVNAVDG
mmetsp:Transcript_25567/g.33444  ORF Transcript_25567/g.33444 Transcript_25567/m.33444 type:complete len:82 (-) Transcript_25567:1567-1812(-)